MTALEYDVALSFAGEDREFVRRAADVLQAERVSVFFDEFETVRLWGKDLAVELALIYGKLARFVVPFVSASYASKGLVARGRERQGRGKPRSQHSRL